MTAAERLERDDDALRRILEGEPRGKVAARYGLSRVQLWRRVGSRSKATIRNPAWAGSDPARMTK